jgi:4-diphosphocytidyl-2-C-methyl-D-erythritol kinase
VSDVLSLEAPAKVNLFLRVLGPRPDGFHEIETLFQAVDLCDDVSLQAAPRGGIILEVEGADLGPVEGNLAYRAAEMFLGAAGVSGSVFIRLKKRIPAGAGMGGGSSDAAAVLRLMNALYGEPLGADVLRALGARLGSDVPFFLGSSTTAIGRGRGEVLEAVPPLPQAQLVLVMPPVHVDTGEAYRAVASRGFSEGGPRLRDPPAGWGWVTSLAHNDFQDVVADLHREVREALDGLHAAGAKPALLSGSGASCFGRFPHAGVAASTAQALAGRLGVPCVAAGTLSEFPTLNGPGGSG